jgi:hypothetical protein
MARKKSRETDEPKVSTVLIAAQLIRGGVEKGERAELRAGRQLTKAKAESLGLEDDAIGALVDKGALIVREVRSESDAAGDDAALQAANNRADKAEQDLAAAQQQIIDLTAQLEAAKKASPAA